MAGKIGGEVTRSRVSYVLNRWVLRGDEVKPNRKSRVYFGFVPGLKYMLRVVVSWDDKRLVTAFQDQTATRNFHEGNRAYFTSRYSNLEESHEDIRPLR